MNGKRSAWSGRARQLVLLAVLLPLPTLSSAAPAKAVEGKTAKAKPGSTRKAAAVAKAPAKRSAEDVAIDFYGLAWKLENGARRCVASGAGNGESLQNLVSTMQGLSAPYTLGQRLYKEGRRTPDTQGLDAEIAAEDQAWPQKSEDQVDSACSLLGLGTILSTQAMSDELDQFAAMVPTQPAAPVAPATTDAAASVSAPAAVSAEAKADVLRAVIESFASLGLDSVDRPGNVAANTPPNKAAVLALTPATEERLPVQAFGRDVVYLPRSQIREQMLINFLKIDSITFSDDTHAEVRLFYPYRAMGGTVKAQRTASGWQTDSSDISINPPGAQLFYSELFDGKACVDGSEYARWKNAFNGIQNGMCKQDQSSGITSVTATQQ